MATSPKLYTRRLVIKPFEEKHLTNRYLNWLNDKDLMMFSEQRLKSHTMKSCKKYCQSFKGTPNYLWAIEEIETNWGHIGNINAYVDVSHLVADIGIVIGKAEAKSQKYGLEALNGVIDFLFNKVGMQKVTAGTLSVNIPMIKLMKSAGMTDDGIRKRHYIFENHEVDIIYMALFKKQVQG